MSQMLYKYPSVNEQNLEQSGYTKVEREKYDYIIIAELDADKYLKDGWWKTAKEARKGKSSGGVNVNPVESDAEDEMEVYPQEVVNEELSLESLKKVAGSLKVKYPPNIKDKTLLKKVRKALPTREELERIADDMKIDYRSDIHDENLYEKISDALEE